MPEGTGHMDAAVDVGTAMEGAAAEEKVVQSRKHGRNWRWRRAQTAPRTEKLAIRAWFVSRVNALWARVP